MARILMVVANPCVNDARVIKEAEALAEAGHAVRVLCRWQADLPRLERQRGVEYERIPMGPELVSLRYWLRRDGQPAAPMGERAGSHEQSASRDGVPLPNAGHATTGRHGFIEKLRERYHRNPDAPGWVAARVSFQAVWKIWCMVRAVIRFVLRVAKQVVWQLFRYSLLRFAALRSVTAFQPDVIHAHDLFPLPLAVAAAGGRAKVVYDAHELETHRNGLGWLARQVVGVVEKRYIGRADAVITVSPGISEYLARHYGIAAPTVILNAPEWARGASQPPDGGLRVRLGLAPDVPLVVYVGKLTFNRGIEPAVRALSGFEGAHLALVGPQHRETAESVQALAGKLGIRDRVHIVDPVPPGEVIGFIASADVGIVPTQDACLSYRYSMPNKLFEMTFAALPICASDLPDQRRFVEEAGNGILMNEKSPADIGRALREAWERRSELRPGVDQLERLARKYAWSSQKQELLGLYARLVAPAATA